MNAPSVLETKVRTVGLVVDDDPVIRLLARQVMERDGLAVHEACDGQDAVERFEELKPDIVLLDVMMPRLDGFAACSEIRQSPRGMRTPVLMLTGLDDLDSINRAFEAGATDFINKPINWGVLGYRIRYMLRSARILEQLAHQQESLAEAQRIAHLGNWEWDIEHDVVYWSQEMYRILDYHPGITQACFAAFSERLAPNERARAGDELRRFVKAGEAIDSVRRIILPDGSIRHVHILGITRKTTGEHARLIAGTIQDITDRKQAEDQIRYLAYYDGLTALPNRQFFLEKLQHSLNSARRQGRILGVLSFDLDHFKRINDTLGHAIGDTLLQAVAQRLAEGIRASDAIARLEAPGSDWLARLGGDEFGVLLADLEDFHGAAKVAHRVGELLRAPFRLGEREIVVTTSIGIALFPDDGDTPANLIRNADAALHFAKEQGRNNCQFYGRGMNARALEKLSMESQLREALGQEQFLLHYQPKIEVASGRIVGVEALIRWRHPELGMVPPLKFIPVAEEIGLIVGIGEWVIRTACREARAWQHAGCAPIEVAVNIAGSHFRQAGLPDFVSKTLAEAGLPAHLLEIELTESMLMSNTEDTVATLRRIKDMGIKLAIDDFGTGYSSLAYLKRFPLDALKIDRSFIKDMPGAACDAALTTAIIGMAHGLNLKVVAEGVEHQSQFDFLKERGCDLIQGYLISRPIPANELVELLLKTPVTHH
jgi:diguanylate cyclase (GGDEF)-like protein